MDDISEKILIYPYGREFAPVIRNRRLLGNCEIAGLVSPPGWGMEGKDACRADRGPDVGMLVHGDFERAIEKCDTVLIADCTIQQDFREAVYRNMDFAVEKGKNIICTLELDDGYLTDIGKRCFSRNKYFKYFGKHNRSEGNEITATKSGCIAEITVPVVLIGGISENTGKFEIQMALRNLLLDKGYSVGQIGSRHYCELFGFHSFPRFIYETGLSEPQKIIMFNHYVKSLEAGEHPDVILIGVPGDLTLFDRRYPGHFGAAAFLISNAVIPDFFVLSILYTEAPVQINIIKTLIEKRMGFSIDCINISNAQFDLSQSNEKKQKCYNYLPYKLVDDRISSFGKTDTPLVNILNERGREETSSLLIDTLSDYCGSENMCIGGI
jgi:peptide maturation system protein (TIGR04066 family)